jgi:hypothetical protein
MPRRVRVRARAGSWCGKFLRPDEKHPAPDANALMEKRDAPVDPFKPVESPLVVSV